MTQKLFIIWIFAAAASAQEARQQYPYWFLHQGDLACRQTTVGYGPGAFYKDSALSAAFGNALVGAARNRACRISGGEAFWITSLGFAWMGNNITEVFDTAEAENLKREMTILDSIKCEDITVVLAGNPGCKLSEGERALLSVSGSEKPGWVDEIPVSNEYFLAVGLSPEYYYERSSWEEAEKMARKNLARDVLTRTKSFQKSSADEHESVINEELSTTVRGVQILERWKDTENRIVYVLARMRK